MKWAVFLDRDGTINEEVEYLTDPDDVRLLPGATEAVRMLNEVGVPAILVTNQSAIARGYLSPMRLEEIHREIGRQLAARSAHLDAIYVCPHHPDEGCACRKPNPGMLERAAEERSLDLCRSFMVGDKASDMEAGRRAGCQTVFVLTGYGAQQRQEVTRAGLADFVARNLLEGVKWVLAQRRQY